MKKLYRFLVDSFRGGKVESVFIAHEKDVTALVGKEIYFGEILGKHSELEIYIDVDTIIELSTSQLLIKDLEKIFSKELSCDTTTISGYNPVMYAADDEERRLEELEEELQEKMWEEEENKRQWMDEQRRRDEQRHWEEQNEV